MSPIAETIVGRMDIHIVYNNSNNTQVAIEINDGDRDEKTALITHVFDLIFSRHPSASL